MRRTLVVISLALFFMLGDMPAFGKDASFRCGNTFVDTGDSRAKVLHHCGEPYQREIIGYVRSLEKEELIEFVVEAWTYNSAPDMFNIITFKGNRVLNVESEKK